MIEILLYSIIFLLIVAISIIIIRTKATQTNGDLHELHTKIDYLERSAAKTETTINENMRASREEQNRTLSQMQQAVISTLAEISKLQSQQLEALTRKIEEQLGKLIDKSDLNAKDLRESISNALKEFSQSFTQNVKDFNEMQRTKFNDLVLKQDEMVKITEVKLEKMRETVDEKLQKTLEARLGQSFELVSKQLESVQKGLGEMQTLAYDVGGLKKVLSNVKTRGILGEIQLGNILEQILAPEQYEANVRTKKGSNDQVEFAIKLPGRDDLNTAVYLPVDAKFPQESYNALQDAYDVGDIARIETETKSLVNSIKKFAKDIRDKYIDPPNTTDFGIMFLPSEGLYAEIVRRTDLIEQLQREFKIVVTGPTTLAAILNSLQMGFKTLAIQKRSSEVWEVLKAVKTEFGEFGKVLSKAKEKIDSAGSEIDKLVGVRTRQIQKKLSSMETLSLGEAQKILDEGDVQPILNDPIDESEE